jgi:SHAQKYF class myb-like DNA-binding protein
MTISWRVQQTFFSPSPLQQQDELIRLPPTLLFQTKLVDAAPVVQHKATSAPSTKKPARSNLWTLEEHERFLQGLEMFRNGPWKRIAAVVGTKTTRQTMTHAQKYRQKIERRQRVADAIATLESAAWSPSSTPSLSPSSPSPSSPSPPTTPADVKVDFPGETALTDEWDMPGLNDLLSATFDGFDGAPFDPCALFLSVNPDSGNSVSDDSESLQWQCV